jgi:putative membrane protein
MLWIKAFHIISVITYFAGIFYLPRLFVYHAMSDDKISIDRFKVMERKLYRGIINPSAVVMVVLGAYLVISNWNLYSHFYWLHIKLTLIIFLALYHFYCYKFLVDFRDDKNTKSHIFYRYLNEIPVLLLIAIIILVVVKPF